MLDIYLLPCHGDNSVEITTAEAGRTVRCPCGKRVTAPTLREIQNLPRKESAQPLAAGSANWSVRQGVMFSIGLFLAAACFVAVVWLGYQRWQVDTSETPTEQADLDAWNEHMMAMDAANSLDAWNYLKHRLPDERQPPQFEINRGFARQIYLKMGVAGVIGVIGIGLMLAGVTFIPRPARGRKKPAKRPAAA